MFRHLRKHSRSQLIDMLMIMAEELEQRASGREQESQRAGYRHAARHLHEIIGIANGQRSAAYWLHKRTRQMQTLTSSNTPQPMLAVATQETIRVTGKVQYPMRQNRKVTADTQKKCLATKNRKEAPKAKPLWALLARHAESIPSLSSL